MMTRYPLNGSSKIRQGVVVPHLAFIRPYFTIIHLYSLHSVDSLDWKDLIATEIAKRVTGKVQSGSICLFHNAALHTPEALPSILEFFKQNGYTVVPISQLLLTGEYYMDHTGKQCPAENATS